MTTDPATKDATFYVQIEPVWSQWRDTDGQRVLRGAKILRATQNRPNPGRGGAVVVKLTVRLPDSVFMPLRPEAIVVVPESMTALIPEVIAEDPT